VLWSLTVVAPAHATAVLPLDNTWITIDDYNSGGVMHSGDFFTEDGTSGSPTLSGALKWTWTIDAWVNVDITDFYVATDRYNVYDNDVLVGSLLGGTDWASIVGCNGNPFDASCGWVATPDLAWGNPFFAQGSFLFAPGTHSLAIEDVYIPLQRSGTPFPDGTVAFRAADPPPPDPVVPEPATLLLVSSGLACAGHLSRKRKHAR